MRKGESIPITSNTGNSSPAPGIFCGTATRNTRSSKAPPCSSTVWSAKFQPRMKYVRVESESGPDFFEVKDTQDWYEKAIRMGIFDWQVGFSCRSVLCQRGWCPLHRGNPHRISPLDIYGLLTMFERIPATTAKTQVGKWFGMKLGELEATGAKTAKRHRRKVPKKAFYDLLKECPNMRTHQVKELSGRLHTLIMGSPSVEWHRRLFDEATRFV